MSQKQPWEEEWGEYMGVNTCGVRRTDGTTIAVRVPDYPTAKLMSAAPAMARALLAQGYVGNGERKAEWHTSVCWEFARSGCTECCKAARTALAKAGVPLP